MKGVCLDFDGVVINSVEECYLTSWNAYSAWNGLRAEAEPERASFFRRWRKFVRPAGEYWVLHHAWDSGIRELDEAAFAELQAEHAETICSFEPLFFAERDRRRKEDMRGWLALNPPYPKARECLQELTRKWPMFIVTTKDAESVRLLLDHFSIPIEPDRIYGKERHAGKAEAVESIAHELAAAPQQLCFLDDHPGHLKEVSRIGATCVWASWGYYDNPSGFEGLVATDWESFLELITIQHEKGLYN